MNTEIKLKRPGISEDFLKSAGIKQVDSAEASSQVGIRETGILIPYKTYQGRDVVDAEEPFSVLRLNAPTGDKKYSQRKGSTTHIYIPPELKVESADSLVIVEGEFKALSLWERGIPAVGIKGFYGALTPKNTNKLHPELIVVLKNAEKLKTIEFLGDTDTAINKDFANAAVLLAKAMVKTEFSSLELTLPRLPYDGEKGVDDCFEVWDAEGNEKWNALERIPLDPEESKGNLQFKLLDKLNEANLKSVIEGGGKPEKRLYQSMAAMHEDPRLQKVFSERIVGLGIQGLGMMELKRVIKKAAEENSHRKDFDKGKLDEIVKKTHRIGSEMLYPRSPEDPDNGILLQGDPKSGGYMQMARDDFERFLVWDLDVSKELVNGPNSSEVDYVLGKIGKKPKLSYIGEVAGYPAGLHEYQGKYFFVPQERYFEEGQQGECPQTIEYIQRLLGKNANEPHWEHQFHILMGLLKATRKMVKNYQEKRTVPPLMLIGAKGCGKTHFQTEILPYCIDGKYSLCETQDLLSRFNAEQIGNVITILSDSEGDGRYRARKDLAGYYKKIAANPDTRCEGKGKEKTTLPSKRLIVASANDDTQEDLAAIPPVAGIEDKVIYLRCFHVNMWKGMNDPEGTEIQEQIRNEVQAFCYCIDNYVLPEECSGERYGVATWQHPICIEAAEMGSPSERVSERISKILQEGGEIAKALFGGEHAHDLDKVWELLHGAEDQSMPKLAKTPSSLGHILRHVKTSADKHPERGFAVEKKTVNGYSKWVFAIREGAQDV